SHRILWCTLRLFRLPRPVGAGGTEGARVSLVTSQTSSIIGPADLPADALAAASADDAPQHRYFGLSVLAWLEIAIVGFLLAATFRFNLRRLWLKTNPFTGEANWGHAIVVPAIALYYLYINREELLRTKVQ